MKNHRLIGIINVLLKEEKVTISYLAKEFQVSKRTISKDLENLCKAGIPIIRIQGLGGGVCIKKYDDHNKTIVSNLKKNTSTNNEQVDKEIFKITKDKNILIDLSYNSKSSLSFKIERLYLAIDEKRLITFVQSTEKGESYKIVEPYLILFKWSNWYVFCYCLVKKDFLLIKINSIWKLSISQKSFIRRDIPDEKIKFDNYFENKVKLLATFGDGVKHRLKDEYGLDIGTLSGNEKAIYEIDFANKEDMLNWVLSFGDNIEVISPNDLRNDILKISKRMTKKYSES